MTADRSAEPAERLIGGAFDIDFSRVLDGAGGGLRAWAAIDRRGGQGGLMAVEVHRNMPARAAEVLKFRAGPVAGVLCPLEHGGMRDRSGRAGTYVICDAPPGPALLGEGVRVFAPWDEAVLLRAVLRPAALALEQLRKRSITHRAIRPENLFRMSAADPAVLGCGWAAPPGAMQDAIYEPPYSAMCLPAGRGNGSTADDVYALGVTMLVLAMGQVPFAGADPADVVQQKLDRGSYAALAGDARLPQAIQDLVRGMLAEDTEHRPTPALLADPEVARGRRVAARPPRRAQKALEIGPWHAWSARMLAYAMAREPALGLRSLRSGAVDRWLRRGLGDSALTARLEEVLRLRSTSGEASNAPDDPGLLMRAIAILDPLAPLCWDGIALWPDGLGPALVAADGDDTAVGAALSDLIGEEAMGIWGMVRPERCDPLTLRLDGHQNRALLQQRGWGGGLARLRYALNPMLPCRSTMLAHACVDQLPDLLPALDRVAGGDSAANFSGLDQETAAFIAERSGAARETDLMILADGRRPDLQVLAALRLLAAVQTRLQGAAVPALTRWFGQRLAPALLVFEGRTGRSQRQVALDELSASGRLADMVGLIDDAEGLATDRREQADAAARVDAIDRRLDALLASAGSRAALAQRLGQEGVTALALLALVYAVMTTMFL